ncbi:MAG: 30S ribosomal protein S16 [Candidatus Shikimatogenerans sp. AspAUS03]|uniref:Small ribosomal subunit protein bS16 n=1 Tax=Candidatus Shikimatogenerans sp. AspAUS03 TaxID=3158563 RepID=A0AAU7QSV4_9FLAO
MSVRIRLQQLGKKRFHVYRIVVADSRCPRNGKIIFKLGYYNPNFKKNIIKLSIKNTIKWLKLGAQPNMKTKSILKTQGVYYLLYLYKKYKFKEKVKEIFKLWNLKKKKI